LPLDGQYQLDAHGPGNITDLVLRVLPAIYATCDIEGQPMDFSPENIFQMFVSNGSKPGFWIVRTTWGNTCAKVTSVGELTGPPPYYGNPKVFAEIYNRATGEMIDRNTKIPVPGTYKTWRLIDAPEWAPSE